MVLAEEVLAVKAVILQGKTTPTAKWKYCIQTLGWVQKYYLLNVLILKSKSTPHAAERLLFSCHCIICYNINVLTEAQMCKTHTNVKTNLCWANFNHFIGSPVVLIYRNARNFINRSCFVCKSVSWVTSRRMEMLEGKIHTKIQSWFTHPNADGKLTEVL